MQSSSNAFQMDAQMRISARLPQAVPPQTWERDWLASLPGVQIGAGGVGIQAYKADRNSDLARAFLGAIRSNAGVPSFVNKSGTADMNIVAPAWNCPTGLEIPVLTIPPMSTSTCRIIGRRSMCSNQF
jgi:LysW-gamma-L-lysine carboxypeptidase